ncbi:MAG: hypothetical protein ACK4HW_04045 [Roseinatronobacter sp.]
MVLLFGAGLTEQAAQGNPPLDQARARAYNAAHGWLSDHCTN